MDLLPNEEMMNFQKLGLCGKIINRRVRISDLEKVDKATLDGKVELPNKKKTTSTTS